MSKFLTKKIMNESNHYLELWLQNIITNNRELFPKNLTYKALEDAGFELASHTVQTENGGFVTLYKLMNGKTQIGENFRVEFYISNKDNIVHEYYVGAEKNG